LAGETFEAVFDAARDAVYAAAVETSARFGYTTLEARPEAGILSFNTGRSMKSYAGQDMTVMVVDAGAGRTKAIVGGTLARHGAQLQLGAWGEKKTLANKFLAQLALAVTGDVSPPEGWLPDPSGRYPDRWWDGAQWTKWVRDKPGGTRSEDPPGSLPAPTAPLRQASASEPTATPDGPEAASDPIEQLLRLGELRDAGVITPEQFEAKRDALLRRI
jgi:hypothetical protein